MAGRVARSDEDLAAAWHEMMAQYHRVSCSLDRELQARHGLSASEFEVLQQLAGRCGAEPVRMHELGEHVHLSQSALSRVIARLEKDGMVSRQMCTDDRRSVLACITALGTERFEAAKKTQRAVLRDHVGA